MAVQPRRQRVFNLKEDLLDGLSETEVKSHYRFSRGSIQFITDTIAADLERPTARNLRDRFLLPFIFSQVVAFLRWYKYDMAQYKTCNGT